MKSHTLLALLSLMTLSLSACSVYRNKGRDQFEGRSVDRIKTDIGTALHAPQDPEDFSSCWVQSTNEAIWPFPTNAHLSIRHLDNDQMAVCLQSSEDEFLTDSNLDPHLEALR